MNIDELFDKDIYRSINGVVKADQLDENSVWQELDEFVVTRELSGHLGTLVDVLLKLSPQQGIGDHTSDLGDYSLGKDAIFSRVRGGSGRVDREPCDWLIVREDGDCKCRVKTGAQNVLHLRLAGPSIPNKL